MTVCSGQSVSSCSVCLYTVDFPVGSTAAHTSPKVSLPGLKVNLIFSTAAAEARLRLSSIRALQSDIHSTVHDGHVYCSLHENVQKGSLHASASGKQHRFYTQVSDQRRRADRCIVTVRASSLLRGPRRVSGGPEGRLFMYLSLMQKDQGQSQPRRRCTREQGAFVEEDGCVLCRCNK